MNHHRGFIVPLLLIVVVLLLAGGAYVYVQNKQETQPIVRIELLNLSSDKNDSLPTLKYRIDAPSTISGNGFISLVSSNSGTEIWGMEEIPSGTHEINLNALTKFGFHVDVPEGDYFLRLHEWPAGGVLAESAVFHVFKGIIMRN